MNDNINDFLNKEKQSYSDKLSEIVFTIDEIKKIIPEKKLGMRKYIRSTKLLTNYLEKIKDTEKKINKKNIFNFFKSNEKYKQALIDFKIQNKDNFEQVESCLKCACLKCTKDCKINPCLFCNKSKVGLCNKDYIVTFPKEDTVKLEKLDEIYIFNVLSLVFDLNKNKTYILLEDQQDQANKQIFYLINDADEDRYECIENIDEIDKIATIYELALSEGGRNA